MKPNRAASVALALMLASFAATAQSMSWDVPQSTVRAVLEQWARQRGYGVVWSAGIPDFPARAMRIDGDFAAAAAALVRGGAESIRNLYCPPAVSFPATAYTPTVRVDDPSRLVFVYGIATDQECRPG